MSELDFHIATKKDLPTLNSLYADMYGRESSLISEEKIRALWRELQQIPYHHTYIATLGTEAIGTFSLVIMPTIIYPDFHKLATLDIVTVKTPYRGQGWGTKIVRTALGIGAEAGCYKVTLSSSLKRDRAHKFYRSLGFKQHGWSFSYQLNSND